MPRIEHQLAQPSVVERRASVGRASSDESKLRRWTAADDERRDPRPPAARRSAS